MPQQLTYPGVYIEEVPSGVRTITGVATSIAAFVDSFKRGPTDKAVQILGMADFEREFGGLYASSEGSYAIQQFFLNGGSEAWVVRVVPDDAERASVDIATSTAASSTAFTARAKSEGEWGNSIRIRVDNKTPVPGEFNLTVLEYITIAGRPVVAKQEVFRNLSMDSTRTNFLGTVVNDTISGSKLIDIIGQGITPPLSNGTLSGEHTENPVLAQPPQQFTLTIADGSTHQTANAILDLPEGPDSPDHHCTGSGIGHSCSRSGQCLLCRCERERSRQQTAGLSRPGQPGQPGVLPGQFTGPGSEAQQ